jgi:Fe-S cluster assembly iron-binding protein IscA
MLAVPVAASGEQRTATAEDDIKAAFLFNFTQFVEWPVASGDPFRICTVAEPGFDAAVDRTVAGESVGARAIVHTIPASPEAARDCQILFVGRHESGRTDRWVAAVHGLPVLVVGESAAAARGAHINFVLENNRVKFDVNNTAAAQSGLVISSKLLRVARRVLTTGQS